MNLPRSGYVRVGGPPEDEPRRLRGRPPDRVRCVTRKERYETESEALEALVRVRKERLATEDPKPPEARIYRCERCKGWHLTSNETSPDEFKNEPDRYPDETWEIYAKRLEKRIAAQRSEIVSLHAIGQGVGRKNARRRIETLVIAVGRATERYEWERKQRIDLVRKLRDRCDCWWCRLRRAVRVDRRDPAR